ncbi:HEAT repeat domain-containing protein [Streptomyces chartreusis]|uniref:HEAT repeat domain-containing protein n=1 Tax=Streptomyces chartreusis TaxID=1969 RepID=UPI0036C0446E
MIQVLLAHAEDDANLAEKIAEPLRRAGYGVVHHGAILVGESLAGEASKAIAQGSPVVICGTVAAAGTGWAYRLVNAARKHSNARIFALQVEKEAFLDLLSLESKAAPYWQDPVKAMSELIEALSVYYPPGDAVAHSRRDDLEQRYRDIALKTCDIVDLANLPIGDRDLVTKELLLRSLYVSLRVLVEIPPGIDPSDLDSKLQSIETRRGDVGDGERASRSSIGNRLQASKRLVVLGDPGAGKSTLLRWIATAYLLRLRSVPDWRELPDVATLPDVDWLPLLIRCRDLEEREITGSLEEIVRHHLRKSGFPEQDARILTGLLLRGLRDGRVLLLIDGLDEISHPASRARFCRQIEQIHVAYPESSIIVTSRIVGYKEMGLRITRGFEHVTVLDLTPEDKDDFARRWCMVTEPLGRRETAAQQLIDDIHSADRIERLTGNPMLLTTMALVKKKVGKLPSRRADLYGEAVDVLLNWRSDVDERLDRYEALPQLQYLAYSMCEAGVQQLREDEVIATLERMRREFPTVRAARQRPARTFLRLLEGRTGILTEAGHVRHHGGLVPVYEFRHLTFQEYLAGLALVEGRFPGRDRRKSLADQIAALAARTSPSSSPKFGNDMVAAEHWLEAIRLCVMSCNDDDVDGVLLAVVRPLPGEDASASARARAGLGCSCLADEPNVSEDVALEIIERLIGVLTMEDADRMASVVSAALEEIGHSLWGATLIRRTVKAWLMNAGEFARLAGVAATVAGMTTPTDASDLEQWMRDQVARLAEPKAEVAIEAALVLMDVGYSGRAVMVPHLIPRLIAMLSRGPCEATAAAWALGWLRKASPVVSSTGPWQPTVEETGELVRAIETYDFLLPDTVRLLLWACDTEVGQRHPELAAKVMTWFDRGEAYSRELLGTSYVRIFRRAVAPVLPFLDHRDEGVRSDAAMLLARLDTPRVEEPLLNHLHELSGEHREVAIRTLGRQGGSRSADRLLTILAHTRHSPEDAVIEALADLGDPRAVDPLVAVLTGADGRVNGAVATALARLRNSKAIQALEDLRNTKETDRPYSVLAALAALGDLDARQALSQAMQDTSRSKRTQALWALAMCEPDHLDRILLSRDRDAASPGIDPAEGLGQHRLGICADATGLSADQIRTRYEALAGRYSLSLSWHSRKAVTDPGSMD